MKRLAIAVFIAAVLTKPAYALECKPLPDILKKLINNGYAFLAVSIDKRFVVHQFFLNPKTRKWAEIVVSDDLKACILFEGTDWIFAVEEAI